MMKKTITLLLLILLTASLTSIVFADDARENKTVEIEGIKFDAPITQNNTTSFTKLDDGSISWEYIDYDNNVSVFISKTRLPGYNTTESYNELDGYNQIRPIGDWWFLVSADNVDDLRMVYSSAHMD